MISLSPLLPFSPSRNPSSTYRRAAPPPRRRGFTLVELLLVLSLLTVLASLAVLALKRPFANQRLSAAADFVRTQWSLARNEAIRSGATYVFQCVPGGSTFRFHRRNQEPDGELGSWAGIVAARPSADLAAKEPSALTSTLKALPNHLVFGEMEIDPDSAAEAPGPRREPVEPVGGGWSDSICFYPDGTTTDVRLGIINDRGSRVELTLRGLTGTVIVGEVKARREPLP